MQKEYHRVVLDGCQVSTPDACLGVLDLGAAGNYGVHILRLEPGEGWAGLTIRATFKFAQGCAEALMDPVGKEIEVPPSATASPTGGAGGYGIITIIGTDAGGRLVSTKLLYQVGESGCLSGAEIPTDPDVYQQYIEQVEVALDARLKEHFAGGSPGDVWTQGAGGAPGWATPTGGGGTGQNGATFTPSVSPEGEISWTNDKNLPNPPPVNIRGPIGPQGEPGKQGPKGAPGADGPPGKTPVKGVDYWTIAEQRQIVEAAAQAAAEKIPTANAVTPGLVKAQPVAEQGTNAKVGILPDGTLVAPAGAGGGSQWRKIAEIDIIEPVPSVVVSQDVNGAPFSVRDILVFNTKNITIDSAANGAIGFALNDIEINMNLSVKNKEGIFFKSEWMGCRMNTAGTGGFGAYTAAAGDVARIIIKDNPEKCVKFTLKNSFTGNFTSGNLIVFGRD